MGRLSGLVCCCIPVGRLLFGQLFVCCFVDHEVPDDIVRCRATPQVRRFIVNGYVCGAFDTAGTTGFEGSTSILS